MIVLWRKIKQSKEERGCDWVIIYIQSQEDLSDIFEQKPKGKRKLDFWARLFWEKAKVLNLFGISKKKKWGLCSCTEP